MDYYRIDTTFMEPVDKLTRKVLENIKLLVFDVDGVLVPRGTHIKQEDSVTTLETKVIPDEHIRLIRELKELGFTINISSGRGLYMLQEMFRSVLSFVSLTYENGSASWHDGIIHQHVNSFKYVNHLYPRLETFLDDSRVKGFEPKEFIITLHCTERVPEIEEIISHEPDLYTKWNGEAYDIGVKGVQSKGIGVQEFTRILEFSKENVLAIGDNYNDTELADAVSIVVSADKERLKGDYYIPQDDTCLPAKVLMEHIISVMH